MIQIPIIKAVCPVVPDKKKLLCVPYLTYGKHVNLERATIGPKTIILTKLVEVY